MLAPVDRRWDARLSRQALEIDMPVVKNDEAREIPWRPGYRNYILAGEAQGVSGQLEHGRPGRAPAPRCTSIDEVIVVIDGTPMCDREERILVGKNQTISVPARTPHAFTVVSPEGARFIAFLPKTRRAHWRRNTSKAVLRWAPARNKQSGSPSGGDRLPRFAASVGERLGDDVQAAHGGRAVEIGHGAGDPGAMPGAGRQAEPPSRRRGPAGRDRRRRLRDRREQRTVGVGIAARFGPVARPLRQQAGRLIGLDGDQLALAVEAASRSRCTARGGDDALGDRPRVRRAAASEIRRADRRHVDGEVDAIEQPESLPW